MCLISLKKGINCSTREHLDLILNHASSMPLDLFIDRIGSHYRFEMLKLIVSRNCSIRSLTIVEGDYSDTLADEVMDNLNLKALRNIRLKKVSEEKAIKVMDVAIQSSQPLITIEITRSVWKNTGPFLQHRLLQRVGILRMINGQSIIFIYYRNKFTSSSLGGYGTVTSSQLSLPRLRSLALVSEDQLIKTFDFANIDTLEITLWDPPRSGFPATCLPSQINTLLLTGIGSRWSFLEEHSPHLMPNLVVLRLKNFNFATSLQAHLELPNLKHLELNEEDSRRLNTAAVLVDRIFSPRILGLESLTLRQIGVDETLLLELREYQNLSSLTILEIDAGPLFSALSENLKADNGFFPALRTIKLECFWKENLIGPYEALFDRCTARKPHIDLYIIRSSTLR
jgi:hypothetical protein